jgi:hypothetical protein
MPNMLLVAPSFNGKTSILERFMELHPVDLDATSEVTTCPVVMVESPPTPDVSAFYTRILDALMAPYKPTSSPQEKNSQVKLLFREMGVKMLIIDEIHHLIAGSMNKQRDFSPDGHFKLPHLWPVKLPHGGRSNYDDSAAMAMRAAASLSR